MASDAQRKANAKYLASKKTLTIRIDHDEADEVSEAAEKEGQSVQAYFLQAVRNRLDGSTTPGGVVKNSESELLTSEISSCLLSPEQEKALKDAVKDIVLDTSPNPEKRKMLKAELLRAVNETVDECDRMSRKWFYDGSLL